MSQKVSNGLSQGSRVLCCRAFAKLKKSIVDTFVPLRTSCRHGGKNAKTAVHLCSVILLRKLGI